MFNKIILLGRLTKDPDLRYTPNGTAVARFTLAVDRRQAQGREKETDFIEVVAWQKTAEACANYLVKGQIAMVDGRLQIRSYEDNQGVRRKVAEVIADGVKFLSKPKENSGNGASGDFYDDCSFNDDDVPF
jgi:single-strand DNA-binding protein